jgi:hypothetical protein
MRIVLRTLITLALVSSFGGLLAGTASAGSLKLQPSIKGAGTILEPIYKGSERCGQRAPVSDDTVHTCWTLQAGTQGTPWTISLIAGSEPGWRFVGWSGCPNAAGRQCNIDVPADASHVEYQPQAAFVDIAPPELIAIEVAPLGDSDRLYRASWTVSEPVPTNRCSVDGGDYEDCSPGDSLSLSAGRHTLSVYAVDASGHTGAPRERTIDVLDTTFTEAPAEGAFVTAARFAAQAPLAGELQCSLDGLSYYTCARGDGPLALPALADGRHTLSVRAAADGQLERVPATRTWTLDTIAPETTLPDAAGGFTLASNEPGVTFRCRLDGAAVPCATVVMLPLAPGQHTFEAAAVDRVGHVDATPASRTWTVAAPTTITVTVPATAAPATPRFALRYTFRNRRFTKLIATGVPAGTKLSVTVKRPRVRPRTTTLARLIGKRLPNGTTVTVRAGSTTRVISIRRGRAVRHAASAALRGSPGALTRSR